eukprot:scaffold4376_cov199-Amphora_coffeaeformis.AAC.2
MALLRYARHIVQCDAHTIDWVAIPDDSTAARNRHVIQGRLGCDDGGYSCCESDDDLAKKEFDVAIDVSVPFDLP